VLGVLLIDKPAGITSHDAVRQLRRTLGTRRIGHAGTLDPLATGLLVFAVGSATRFLQYLPLEPKAYEFTVRFGTSTTTYDSDGEPVSGGPVPQDLAGQIEGALDAYRGPIEQLPPVYSAVKHEGRPLYDYARKGQEAPREPRRVHVDRFELLGVDGGDAEFRVVCSGGTYVRSLAHDLGGAVGCGAHVVRLVRTSVGRFGLEDALPLAEAGPEAVMPLAEALPPMPLVRLNEGQVERVRHGLFVRAEAPPVRLVALTDPHGEVVGIARNDGTALHPECVLPGVEAAGHV
jgi:tRNA pseudouridine55 synthase